MTILYLVLILIGVAYTVMLVKALRAVLLGVQQPEKAIAWILVLIFIPVAGLIFYSLVGRDIRKEKYISGHCASQLARKSMLGFYRLPAQELPHDYAELIHLFHRQNGALPFPDNHLNLFTHADDMLICLIRDIVQAQHHIHLQTYIIGDDAVGRLVADALMERARAGVEVRFIYDDVGCWRVPHRFFEALREAGADVRPFMPVRLPVFASRVNYRNHRKVVVIDGRVGYIGGMNLALRYVRGTGKSPWRDTHLRITGSAVYGLQRAFLEDWFFVDRSVVSASKYYPPVAHPSSTDGAIIQIVSSNPVSPWRDIMQGIITIVMRARQYVYIQTPYFLPAEPLLFALQTAALSGVDVRIMLPRHSDSNLMDRASSTFIDEVLRAGVQVYLYEAGFLHSKLVVSDDLVATCGSTNMDFRSFEHNLEINAFIYDADVARQIKTVFTDDQKTAQPLSLRRLEKHIRQRRFGDALIRLITPLL
jgi:cardiolipin synthase